MSNVPVEVSRNHLAHWIIPNRSGNGNRTRIWRSLVPYCQDWRWWQVTDV